MQILRRNMVKLLGLMSFGLFLPATNKAEAPKYSGGIDEGSPFPDRVTMTIYHQGKSYNLGAMLTDDPEQNQRRYRFLIRSHEQALWALGAIESDIAILGLGLYPGMPELSDSEKLARYRQHLLRQMHGGGFPVQSDGL